MKQCHFCTNNIKQPDYKNVEVLTRFTDTYGRIVANRRSGVCGSHQRKLTEAIKHARFLALMPFIAK